MAEQILAALDLAHAGAKVLDTAREIAELHNAELRIITVLPPVPAVVDVFLPSGYQANATQEAITAMKQRLAEKGIAEDAHHFVVRHGTPYDEIIKYSKEIKADLIVIGSHAPTASDYLLGSTAAKVVRHAACSVFIVRPNGKD